MGCFWSSSDCERCQYCNRKAVNELIIVNNICEICAEVTKRNTNVSSTRSAVSVIGPFYGEYKCSSCGRYWNSRLCWLNSFQNCKTCRRPVYAYNFRSLNLSDLTHTENKEHPKEFCGKCKQLGYYCGAKKRIKHSY